MHSSPEKETEYLWNILSYSSALSTIHHVLVLCSVLFLSPGSCFLWVLPHLPALYFPLTLDAKTMDPAWSQLHLLLNVPFWVLLLMLTVFPSDIFSWNPGWTHHLELGHVRGWWTDYLHDLGSATYQAISCGWRRALGRRVEKRSCVSDMAKADLQQMTPVFWCLM